MRWEYTSDMNLSRNFTTVVAGRYQTAINRAVDVLDSELVPDPNHPNDRTKDKLKWRGHLLKTDGVTVENVLYFESDGSAWAVRTTSTPLDLRNLMYAFAPAAPHSGRPVQARA